MKNVLENMIRINRNVWILGLRGYQAVISPLLGPCCRFYPSCSEYCVEAIRRHGCLRGSLMGAHRICRCHPLNPGGVDMVPATPSNQRTSELS